MTWQSGKSYHVSLDLDASWEVWGRYCTNDGRLITAYEFEEIRARCKARGLKVFPPCDHVDEKTGYCAGHERILPAATLDLGHVA